MKKFKLIIVINILYIMYHYFLFNEDLNNLLFDISISDINVGN